MFHCTTKTVYRQPPGAHDVESAREELLGQSDWAGLTTTRPARLNHSARVDRERVGRRRKVSTLKRKRAAPQASAEREGHDKMRPLRRAPSLRTEDISIRVGSNIHRTQTTPSIFARKGSTQPTGGQTAQWLPVAEPPNNSRQDTGSQAPDDCGPKLEEHGFHTRNGSATGPTPTIKANLVPLKEAVELSLSSWDMVREHSSKSRSRTDAPSSLLPSDPSFLEELRCNLGVDPGSIHSQDNGTFTRLLDPHEHSTPQNARPKLPLIFQSVIGITDNTELVAGQESALPPFQQRDARQDSSILRTTPRPDAQGAQLPGLSFHDIPGSARTARRPRFALDAQIDLEHTVELMERQTYRRDGSVLSTSKVHQGLPADDAQFSHDIDTSAKSNRLDMNFHKLTNLSPGQAGPRTLRHTLETNRDRSTYASHTPHVTTYLSPALDDTRGQKNHHGQVTHVTNYPTFAAPSDVPVDNDAWTKFAFPAKLSEMNDSFQRAASHLRAKAGRAHQLVPSSTDDFSSVSGDNSSFDIDAHNTDLMTDPFESSRSIPTGVNTSLFIRSSRDSELTETDFLSRLSPMEGCLDERLVDLSVYNNAARTEHSFWTAPGLGAHLPRPSASASTDAMLKPLVPAKRATRLPAEAATTGSRRRCFHTSAPSPQKASPWSFNIRTKARQGSTRTVTGQNSKTPLALPRSPVLYSTNNFDTSQNPTHRYWTWDQQSFAPVADAAKSPG